MLSDTTSVYFLWSLHCIYEFHFSKLTHTSFSRTKKTPACLTLMVDNLFFDRCKLFIIIVNTPHKKENKTEIKKIKQIT